MAFLDVEARVLVRENTKILLMQCWVGAQGLMSLIHMFSLSLLQGKPM